MAKNTPSYRRRRLGKRLRLLREAANLSLEEAAPPLDMTRSTLNRVELGVTKASVHLIRSMMDLYDQRDDDLLDLARDAAKKPWWRHYGLSDLGYVDMETEANAVFEFTVLNIPGLLQTDAYIRATFNTVLPRTEDELRNQITVRTIRRERLTDTEYPLHLTAILDEAALTRVAGGPEVMREQLSHLVAMNDLASVTVQVLPFDVGRHGAMAGGFALLSFPEQDEPDVLYIEYPTGALHADKPEDVDPAKLVADKLRSQALSPADSVALIEHLAAQRYGGR